MTFATMSLMTLSLATLSLATIVPRDNFSSRHFLKQTKTEKKDQNSNKRIALFTWSSQHYHQSWSPPSLSASSPSTLHTYKQLVILITLKQHSDHHNQFDHQSSPSRNSTRPPPSWACPGWSRRCLRSSRRRRFVWNILSDYLDEESAHDAIFQISKKERAVMN